MLQARFLEAVASETGIDGGGSADDDDSAEGKLVIDEPEDQGGLILDLECFLQIFCCPPSFWNNSRVDNPDS